MIGEYIFLVILWSLAGGTVICALAVSEVEIIFYSDHCEFFNPFYCYKHARVNWFGAFMMALGFALLSPLWAVGFWFFKLCTVGRR